MTSGGSAEATTGSSHPLTSMVKTSGRSAGGDGRWSSRTPCRLPPPPPPGRSEEAMASKGMGSEHYPNQHITEFETSVKSPIDIFHLF